MRYTPYAIRSKKIMKLLIDIGNTNTSMALAKGKRIYKKYFIYTSKKEVQPASLKRLLRGQIEDIDSIVVVSVVPKFLTVLKKGIKKILPDVELRVVGRDIKVPMKNKYKDPKEVGQDRLVTSFAAYAKLKSPLIVVDFGTAVTFDCVSPQGHYEGGLIFPGIRLALESLTKEAALLPKIEIKPSGKLIGRDTKSSMNNGIIYGYANMCDGMIDMLRKRYNKKAKVIATGGFAPLISKYSRRIDEVSKDLIFQGLIGLS